VEGKRETASQDGDWGKRGVHPKKMGESGGGNGEIQRDEAVDC